MATDETPSLPPPSADHRRVAAERFDRANQVIATGDYDYGIQLLTTCCSLDPANMLYRQTLRRTQKAKFNNNLRGSRLAMVTTARTRARLKSARRSREYQKVLEYGEEILTKNPWDLSAQMDMAEAADALGLLDIAIFFLDQARQKYPKNPTLNRALARLFEKRGNFSHAIALWQLVKEASPGDLEASHKAKDLAASETIQRGQYEESLSGEKPALKSGPIKRPDVAPVDRATVETSALLTRIEANPTEASLYIQLSATYRKFNQLDRARAALEQGLGPTGNNYQIMLELMEMDLEPFRRNLLIAEEKIREKAEAPEPEEDDIEETDGPTLEDLRKIRLRLMKEINSREIELYRVKADRYPHDLSYRLELGYRLMRADQIEQAIVELQQARKDAKLVGRAALYLGFCFKRRNNWRLAQRNFEEALAQLPETDEANRKELLFQLAQGLAEAGELARAIDLGHDLANLDFGFRDIGRLLDEWQERLQQA